MYNANNFTVCVVKLFVQVENVLDEQHRQIMTYTKDHLNPSAGSDNPWHMSYSGIIWLMALSPSKKNIMVKKSLRSCKEL